LHVWNFAIEPDLFANMIELEQALKRILDLLPPPEPEIIPLIDGRGRILLDQISSSISLPLFDNSAMDGYAVRSEDVTGASPSQPAALKLIGRIAAGEAPVQSLRPHECIRLFTGSPIPPGCNAVVMQEETRPGNNPDEILVLEPVKPWENIRFKGEDLKEGVILAKSGEVLSANLAGLLAAAGIKTATFSKSPVVAVMATGNELQEPGNPLEPGQIYESNRVMIASLIQQCGGFPVLLPLVPDNLESTRKTLEEALSSCDAIVTSGGVSVGEHDWVKTAFQQAGGAIDFWKVAIKPGKPFVWGRKGKKVFFGLPGNPVSAFVTFLLLVRPALLRMQGATSIELAAHPALLAEPFENRGDRRHFIRLCLDRQGNASSAGVQGSHALSSLGRANALLDLPPKTTLPAGAAVRVLRWQ
jgi:molybdopterin molybdotransferase